MVKIKIIQNTPFDRAGVSLTVYDFRAKYGYICSKYVTDKELIDFLRKERKLFLESSHTKPYIDLTLVGFYFEVMGSDEPELPTDFILEGIVYRKEFDGLYYMFVSGAQFRRENSLGCLTIEEARKRFDAVKHKSLVWYCTNDLNKQLSHHGPKG